MPLLKEISLDKTMTDEEYKKDLKKLQHQLRDLHNRLYRKKVPVIIAYEGWDAAGKGSVLGKVIKDLDPRFFDVRTMDKPSEEELRRPFLYKYFAQLPEAGQFMFLEGGWMDASW